MKKILILLLLFCGVCYSGYEYTIRGWIWTTNKTKRNALYAVVQDKMTFVKSVVELASYDVVTATTTEYWIRFNLYYRDSTERDYLKNSINLLSDFKYHIDIFCTEYEKEGYYKPSVMEMTLEK